MLFRSSTPSSSVEPLVPSSLMADETKWLLSELEKTHFKKLSLESLDKENFLTNYVKNLDKQKLFFDQSDISRFLDRYSPTLVTYLRQGNLFPAFEIFGEYRQLALQRLDKTQELLEELPKLDSNETFLADRSEVDWAQNKKKLDEAWTKLIKHEVINEVFSQIEENETIEQSINFLDERQKEALQRLKKKYERWNKNILEFEPTDVQELYLSTLTQMFDPHTSFLNIKEKEKFDQIGRAHV